MLYKGYVETKNKKCLEKFKGKTTDELKTYDEVKNLPEFAGILADDTILVDVDDSAQAEILMNIVEHFQLDCRVICTTRGKHFLFKNTVIDRCATHTKTAIGLEVDIKVGSKASYEVLKVDGEERFIEWDVENPNDSYALIPKWLYPVKCNMDFLSMDAGDGRNQALFNYILTLQSNDFTVEETREAIRILNSYVLKEPLSDDELEVILRDEAFQKPVFYKGSTFLFDKFAIYIRNVCHVVRINNQLHIYKDGIYVTGYREIERLIIQQIPNLKKTQRREVIDYLELIAERKSPADANYIAFQNGIYDIAHNVLLPFSPDMIITNRIEWDYNPNAYFEETDKMLDRIACHDAAIRALLEECVGYCFYRRNELGKAFILTGDKSNGKSTFLDLVKAILGTQNVSALELKDLGDRFSTSMLFGKLANISDDISDDFLQGNQVATFKKVVTGNRLKAENKGLDPFEFEPYAKIICSANDIPRMKDKTGAVLRRLVIIPFNATFTKSDPDFNPWIKYDLLTRDSMEYMIILGLEGLKRVISNNDFTKSESVQEQLSNYEEENNPILGFLKITDLDEIDNEPPGDVYKRYCIFCAENNMQPMGNAVFTKQICKRLKLKVVDKRINGKKTRVFERI